MFCAIFNFQTRSSDQRIILLHKPHPGDEMSIGAIKDLAIRLEEMGEL